MRYWLVMAAVAVLGALIYTLRVEFAEVDVGKYHAVPRAFKLAGPAFQRHVATAVEDGMIRRWEYDSLRRSADADHVRLDKSFSEGSVAEDKVVLMAMARQIDVHGGPK